MKPPIAHVVTVSLLAAGAVGIMTGASFGLVALAVARRAATNGRRTARRAHSAWWLALGSYLVLQGTMTLLAGADALTLDLYLSSRLLAIPLLTLSVWGITSYLVYLYAGTIRIVWPLAAAYACVAALFFYATFASPQSLVVSAWLVGLDDSSTLYRVVYVLVGVPPILASLAYLALLRRVRSPWGRYRIVLLSGSILLYVGSGLAARLTAGDVVVFTTLVVFGIGAAAASLAAYYPPPAVRRALGEES